MIKKKKYNDFGNDAGLAEGFEEEGEGAGDDEDEANLEDGQWNSVVERVVTLERPIGGGLHWLARSRRHFLLLTFPPLPTPLQNTRPTQAYIQRKELNANK